MAGAIRENLTRARRRSRQFLRLGRDEPGANRKSHQAGDIVDLQSAHQLQAMRLNCLHANPQQIRDLLCILSFCDKLQYFALPKRELLQLQASGLSGFSLCRLDIGYLNPLPSAFSHRDCELMCPRRVENILGAGKSERKSADRDHLLTRELAVESVFEFSKAPRAQIVAHPGRTATQ